MNEQTRVSAAQFDKAAEIGWGNIRSASAKLLPLRDAILRDREGLMALEPPARQRRVYAYIASATFAVEGVGAFDRKIKPLHADLPEEVWLPAYMNVLTASARFDELVATTRRRHREAPSDRVRLTAHLRALLSAGRTTEAAALARRRVLPAVRNGRRKVLESKAMELPLRLLAMTDGYEALMAEGPSVADVMATRIAPVRPAPDDIARGPQDYPFYVLNLDRDSHRFARLKEGVGPGVDLTRIPGVPGAAIPQILLEEAGLWRGDGTAPKIGCHLSHVHTWEKTTKAVADDDYVLVFEDDSQFIFGPLAGIDRAMQAAREADLDVLYISERLAGTGQGAAGPRVDLIDDLLREALDSGELPWRSGSDAYLLSGRGARKLLEIEFAMGISVGLDHRLVVAGVEDLSLISGESTHTKAVAEFADMRRVRPDFPVLRAGVYGIALTRSEPYGFTSHTSEKHSSANID